MKVAAKMGAGNLKPINLIEKYAENGRADKGRIEPRLKAVSSERNELRLSIIKNGRGK